MSRDSAAFRRYTSHTTSVVVGLVTLLTASAVEAQTTLPFFPGEELTYRVRLSPFGTVGTGTMKVEGPVSIRGTETYVLRSEVLSTVPMVRGVDRSASWIDPVAMRTLRFEKYERSPFAKLDEAVEIYANEGRWEAADGDQGKTEDTAPLDELSFIYFLRTLPLEPGTSYSFDRHFDPGRNPIRVRVLEHKRVKVGAGEFDATLIEMRVRDPHRYSGEGVIRVFISRDECRLPLRIESAMPRMGTTMLLLEAHTHPASHTATLAASGSPQPQGTGR